MKIIRHGDFVGLFDFIKSQDKPTNNVGLAEKFFATLSISTISASEKR